MAMIVSGSGSTLIGQCSEVLEVTVAADRATGAEPQDQTVYTNFVVLRLSQEKELLMTF